MCRSKQCEDWSGLKRGVHSVPKIITSVKHTKDKYDKEKAPNSDQHTLHKNNGSVTGKANCTFRIFVYILTELTRRNIFWKNNIQSVHQRAMDYYSSLSTYFISID